MGRYDIAKKKKKSYRRLDETDTLATEFEEHVKKKPEEETEYNAGQTPIRGTCLLIRGPNGFQIQIPKRLVQIDASENELKLKLPPNVIRSLVNDINTKSLDEDIRLHDVNGARSRFVG